MAVPGDGCKPRKEAKSPCPCPFCDAPVEKVYPFCKACGKKISFCKKCGKPVPEGTDLCEECSSP